MGELDADTEFGTRILPHLYRVAWCGLTPGTVDCDVYAVDTGAGVVLVDAGHGAGSYPAMKRNLEHWGLWAGRRLCLVTHAHGDHAGGAELLRADGVEIWGHPGLESWPPGGPAGTGVRPDRALTGGERFDVGGVGFEVLATPGHTSTCLTYLAEIDGTACAFTGDVAMPDGTIGYAGSPDFDAAALMDSLERLSRRDFTALLTGHVRRMEGGREWVLATMEKGKAGEWQYRDLDGKTASGGP